MDIIKNKTELYKHIVPLFEAYVQKISTAHDQIYDLIFGVNKYILQIKTCIESIPDSKLSTAEDIFITIHNLNNMSGYLHRVYTMLHIDMTDIHSNMSNTYLNTVENEFKDIIIKYSALLRDNNANDEKLVHAVMDILNSSPVETVNILVTRYPNTVNLYSHYMQYKLDTTDPSSNEYILILDSLDMVKTITLTNADVPGKKLTHRPGVKLQRYGLIPMWQHMDEHQILKQVLHILRYVDEKPRNPGRMYGGYTPDKLTDMSNIFKEKKMGLYVMVLIASNQIEFDFRTLTCRKTLEKIPTIDNGGLNENILTKYNIIKDITTDFVEPTYTNIHMGKTDSDKWVIIRTLNGTHYDIMGVDKDNIIVNKTFIDKLDRGPSRLIDTYQRICSNKLASHLKQPKEIILDNPNTQLQNISNMVIRGVLQYIDVKIDNPPTNLKELFNMAVGPEIEDIASGIIIKSYEEFDNDAGNPELSSTFLVNADHVIKGFVKSVKELLAKSDLNERMFREKTKNALIVHIRTRLSSIVKVSAEKAFDSRNDIYEKLLVKKSLLKIEL
jgi:hypothetical protein